MPVFSAHFSIGVWHWSCITRWSRRRFIFAVIAANGSTRKTLFSIFRHAVDTYARRRALRARGDAVGCRDLGISFGQAIGVAWVERIGNNNGRRPRRTEDGVRERKHGGAIIASGWKNACGSNMCDFRTETVAERNLACLPMHTACQYKILTAYRMSTRPSEL